jgi:Flp pilus assembly protein TadD
VLGVAYASDGDTARGITVLEEALAAHPFNRDLLTALTTYHRDSGDVPAAIAFAERLAEVAPGDPGVAELLRQLRGGSD